MIHLSDDIEALAQKVAAARGLTLEDAVKRAIEESALAIGVVRPRRRLTVEQMLAVGDEISNMPLLDLRSPDDIMNDVDVV